MLLPACATTFFVGSVFAANPAAMPFDISADIAARSLKVFAQQSGSEVIVGSDKDGQIYTRTVKGEMTPTAALDAMLAGTGLVADRHEKTGAYAYRKESGAEKNGQRAAQKNGDRREEKKTDDFETPPKIMTPKIRRTWLGGLFAIITASDPLSAQSVVPPASVPPGPADNERTMLSPFVVNSDKDNGYHATSTLAGTRLNTPIKDIAASISIYTKDFLDDIGATNSSDLLIYATGMEAAGPGGNFSAATNDLASDRVSNEAIRIDPQASGSRTRGLAAPTFTRDYFTTAIPFDSYNTSTVTVNRGPNAALFGTGSAAGVVNTSLVVADPNRDSNKVVYRYGNNDASRGSFDINRVLIPKKLAARIILLQDNQRYSQRPAFEDNKRIYSTLTFQPFKTTSLRGNFESGSIHANRQMTLVPTNDISSNQWLAAGRQGYDWTIYDDPAKNPAAASIVAGPATQGNLINSVNVNGIIIAYSNPTDQTPSHGYLLQYPTTTTFAANAIASQIFNPQVNRDQATDGTRFLHTINVWDLPAAYWTGENVPPGQQPGYVPVGMKLQGFSDYSAFDWRNRMIDESSRQSNSFHTFNVALSQTAWGLNPRVGPIMEWNSRPIPYPP